MRHIADRIDVRHRGLRESVDGDAAVLRIDGDAGLLQAEVGDIRMPADGEHHLIAGDARAVGELRGEFLAVLVDARHRAAGEDGDARLLHLLAHMRAHVVVEPAQDVVAAIDQRHVAAEAGEDAGEFQRDVAAALDQDALRLLLQVKHLVGGDHVLDAGNFRAMIGRGADRDQHMLCMHALAVRQRQRMRILEHRARLDDLGARLVEIGRIGRLETGDFLVLVGDQRRPVERARRDRPAEAGRILDLLMHMRGIDQKLLRHAAADHAGAADPVLLRHQHARAVAGGDPRRTHAARAATDDEQIDVAIGHCLLSLFLLAAYGSSEILAALLHLRRETAR